MASGLKDMSWDQVQADSRFTSASPQQKYNIEKAWKASRQQTPAPTQEAPAQQQEAPQENWATQAGNQIASFGRGAIAGIGKSLAQGVEGTTQAIQNTLGMDTTYSKRRMAQTEAQYKRDMDKSGKAGEYGAMAGQVAGDIGAFVAAPQVALPAIAAREFGRAYDEQKDDDKSIARAGLVGGATYLGGRLLPTNVAVDAATRLGRAGQVVGNVARGAGMGAVGGAAYGATSKYSQDSDATAGQIIGGGLEGGLLGAGFGGGISGVQQAVGSATRRATARGEETPTDSPVPPSEQANLSQQNDAIVNAQSPQEMANAYKTASGVRSVQGSSALEARGIPLTDARFGYSDAAAQAHGVTSKQVQSSRDASRDSATNAMFPYLTSTEAPGKMAVARSQWEEGGRQLIGDVRGSLDSGSNSIKSFRDNIASDIKSRAGEITPQERNANTQQLADIDQFGKDYAHYKSQMNNLSEGESVRTENLLDAAAKARESFDTLPQYFKDKFNSDYKNIGDGFNDGFDPVSHAATYADAFNQLKSMHPSFRNAHTNPSQGAVKGVSGVGPVDLLGAGLRTLRAGKARKDMLAEQSRNADTTRQLAAGLSNAQRRSAAEVEAARANMENPPINDGTQEAMVYSDDVAPVVAPEPTVAPQPDSVLTRTPANRAVPEETATVQEIPPEVAPRVEPDQGLVGSPRRPAESEPEVIPEPEVAPVQEAPRAEPDQTLTRTPNRTQEEVIPEEVIPQEASQPVPDEILTRTPARPEEEVIPVEPEATPVVPEEAVASTPLPTSEPARPSDTASDINRAFSDLSSGVGDAALERVASKGGLTVTRPEAIEALKAAGDKYNYRINEDGSATILGGRNSEGNWVGEAPQAPTIASKSEPDQTLTRTPKPSEKASDEVSDTPLHESADISPKVSTASPKNASAEEQHRMAVKDRAIELVKKMFSIKSVQDKVNGENYKDPRAIQRLKREDVAANTDDIQHAVDQIARKKQQADARKHENNINELETWAKDNDIDYKFVTQAINQKGLQKSNILGVNDIKTRATKLAVEDAKPKKAPEPEAEAKAPINWKDQRDDFLNELPNITPEARARAAQLIDQAFKASAKDGRPMNESNIHGLWEKIYNNEADVLAKAGKAKEAQEAKEAATKAKDDAEKLAAQRKAAQEREESQIAENVKIKNALLLGDQTDEIQKQLAKQLSDSKVPKEQADDFINNYMDENFGVLKTPMGDTKFNSSRKSAIEAARKYGNSFKDMNPAEKLAAIDGADDVTKAASEVFKKVGERVKPTDKDKAQVEDDLSDVLVDKAEAAFREGNSVKDVEEAASALIKAYGLDETAGYSVRRYPKILAKAQVAKEQYPNNPELWLTQTDVDSLAKAGRVNADGMKAKVTDAVLGKRYDSVKLLTEKEANAIKGRVDNGESVDIKIDRGRRGALAQAEEQSAPKAIIKNQTASPNELKLQKAKVARMRRKLNDEGHWARVDNERGQKWKVYKSQVDEQVRILEELMKKR